MGFRKKYESEEERAADAAKIQADLAKLLGAHDAQKASRLHRQADKQAKRAQKMSKKHLRGNWRARNAAAVTDTLRAEAERVGSRDRTPLTAEQILEMNARPGASGNAPGAEPAVAAGPAPGWFPDPQGEARLRWWDGSRWTDHTHD